MDTSSNPLPARLMVMIALIQGLLLLLLHQAIDLKFWPHDQPQWLFAFYSFVLVWPTMLLLGLNKNQEIAFARLSLPFAAICALCGFYVGHQATPLQHIPYGSLLFAFALTIALATFKAQIYAQQLLSEEKISYSALFKWSWRNFLTLGLALSFAGCVWGILMLWAALFNAIEISFFKDLFMERWFYYPAIALANGFGVIIFRNLTGIIDTITRLEQALMKFLLVILTLVSLLFLSVLPFTGLQSLWKSGGSTLILWMQALMLFFLNGVYQDDADRWPYPRWLHRFVCLGVALLPIYSAISFYGLSLRVEQYGWSVARCWAYLIWLLLALFPLGYWWGIYRLRDHWTHQLSRVNIAIGLLLLGSMLLVNTPLLDFRKITVESQLARLASGEITTESFDHYYFQRHLARPGYLALQQIKEEQRASNPALAARIDALYADDKALEKSLTIDDFEKAIHIVGTPPPDPLLEKIYREETHVMWRVGQTRQYYLRSADIDHDGKNEYLLIRQQEHYADISIYFIENNKWQVAPVHQTKSAGGFDARFYEALKNGDIELTRPRWDEIKIGDTELRISQ